MNDVLILAIESSCDETSIAIVKNGKDVLALKTNTQISTHEKYGGVVPEVASRMHCENITIVLDQALKDAGIRIDDVDAIAVTYGPGLLGSLLVGVNFAKVLAAIYNKPLIAINHLVGHIYANNIENNLDFPLLALIVSGGHTEMLYMAKDYDFKLIGQTLDDAVGECYDKIAKVLGEKYPGGPNIEKLAKDGTVDYNFPVPLNNDSMDFSYSGLKSNILNFVNNKKMKGEEIDKNSVAYSFQKTAVKEVTNKVINALNEYDVKQLVVAGGVSANQYLKDELSKVCTKYNVDLMIPSLKYCTDNAAMIGAAAYYKYINNDFADLSLDAISNLKICE